MSSIMRLYREYVEFSDRASRSMGDEHQARVSRIEADICYQLASQPDGVIIVAGLRFQLFAVTIGQEKRSLSYFRVTKLADEPARDDGAGYATHWGRRATDVLPFAAPEKPSLRRKRAE